jgi:hypothetical protein
MQLDQLRRRAFITLLGGAAAWPLSARAQHAKIPHIGFLRHGPASANADRVEALRAGFRQLGYVEGQNMAIEFRWGGNGRSAARVGSGVPPHECRRHLRDVFDRGGAHPA